MSTKADQIIALRQGSAALSLQEIGEQVGVSREYVRQTLKRIGLPTKSVKSVGALLKPRRYQRRCDLIDRMAKDKLRDDRMEVWSRQGPIKLSKGDIGSIAELLVCADLIKRGHDVYRAVNHDSPADLMIYANGAALRVEVKAAKVAASGTWYCMNGHKDRYDVRAMVAPTGEIRYNPDIPLSQHKARG